VEATDRRKKICGSKATGIEGMVVFEKIYGHKVHSTREKQVITGNKTFTACRDKYKKIWIAAFCIYKLSILAGN
jgi:hypothetical protein